jgi:hypothetical protein
MLHDFIQKALFFFFGKKKKIYHKKKFFFFFSQNIEIYNFLNYLFAYNMIIKYF